MIRRVYMDANATTPLLPEVLEAMRPYFVERFGVHVNTAHHENTPNSIVRCTAGWRLGQKLRDLFSLRRRRKPADDEQTDQ